MLVKQFEGVSFPVAIDFGTVEQYRAMGQMSMAKMMIKAGGYASGRVDFQQLAGLLAQYPELDIEGLEDKASGLIISILKDIDDLLTEEQAMCIVYHELGHIVNGDFNGSSHHETKVIEGNMVIDSEVAEIAADQFAAKHFGYAALLDALLAVFKARADVAVANGAPASVEEIMSETLDLFYASERYAEIKRHL